MSRPRPVQEEEDAASLQLGKEFEEAHCLLNSEVLLLLEAYSAKRQDELRATGQIFHPSPVFQKSMQYASEVSRYKNKELIREIRQTMMADVNLAEFEMAQLANLCPETADEAKALIPSLGTKMDDEELQKILDDMMMARRFQS